MVPFVNIFVFLIVGLMALYFYWKFSYWSNRKVKALPVHPIFGSIADVVFKKVAMHDMVTKSYEACKLSGDKYIGFYLLTKPILVVRDLALIKCILASDFKSFPDRMMYSNEKVDPLSHQIASMKGTEWKNMREKLSPAFTPNKIKSYFAVLKRVGEQFKDVLNTAAQNSEVVSVQCLSNKFVVDVIVMVIFGIDCNTLKNLNPEFEYYAKHTLSGSLSQNIKLFLSLSWPSILDIFRIPFNSKESINFFMNVTRQMVEYREKHHIIRPDLMHSLIQIRNNTANKEENNNFLRSSDAVKSKSLTIEQIAAQLTVFFAAGYETTSSNIAFAIYEILCNPNVEEKLRSEINAVLEKYNGEITYEALMEMTYMESCINETARKYPALYGLTRICASDYKIPGEDLIIEKGTSIIIPMINIHHDSTYHVNPEKFDPDRFSPESRARQPNYTFLPFGEGPRLCIGSRLALLEIKLFLTILFKDFTVSINRRTKLPMKLNDSSVLLMLKDELYLDIKKTVHS